MIDKKITWVLIFAVAVESASVFAWAGGVDERLKDVEVRGVAQAERAVRLARVEVQLKLTAVQLNGIATKLDR